jgi:DNA-binding MarR family transcriptional regulator
MAEIFTGKSKMAIKVFNLCIETANAVLKNDDKNLKQAVGLSASQFVVLLVLSSSGGSLTSAKLAQRTGTRPHNITTLVDRMKRDGLVATERGEIDRRFVHIHLTDKGRSVLDKARPAARETVARIFATLAETDLAVLEKLLTVLRRNAMGDPGK